jgi:PHD/YefM family antitoxin component YafN of YafNO toxin-antitoxin module
MIQTQDICSLTDFQRNTKQHIRGLKRSRRPKVLTVNGAAEVVVQDAAAYQELVNLAEKARTMEAIREGLQELRAGKARPLVDAVRDLERREGARR